MAYCSGDLREHIDIYKAVDSPEGGFARRVYSLMAEGVPCMVQSVANKDFANAYTAGMSDTITITLRWLQGLTTADRIEWDGTTYDILGINMLGARRDFMTVRARVCPK